MPIAARERPGEDKNNITSVETSYYEGHNFCGPALRLVSE